MTRSTAILLASALFLAFSPGLAAAQQAARERPAAAEAKKAELSVWDETKTMTRKQWEAAKAKWASEKVQWTDCNRQAKAKKLAAPKSWSFIASCMTKS